MLSEQGAVRQSGQQVVQRQMGTVFLGKFACRDVDSRGQYPDHLAVLVEQRRLVAMESQLNAIADIGFFIIGDRRCTFDNQGVATLFALRQLRLENVGNRTPDQRFGFLAKHRRLVTVNEQHFAVAVGGDDHHRSGIDDLLKHRFAGDLFAALFFVYGGNGCALFKLNALAMLSDE